MPLVPGLLIISADPLREAWARAVAASCGVAGVHWMQASPAPAAQEIAARRLEPSHILLDLGKFGTEIFPEIDQLAQQCHAGTRVLCVGDVSDSSLHHGLVGRGVIDYLVMPADPQQVAALLMGTAAADTTVPAAVRTASSKPDTAYLPPRTAGNKRVIAFLASASGDGASTAALNCAYALSQMGGGRTVLVDADYQYGMIARQLNLQSQYGIRELFDYPGRGIDATLIGRMVATYQKLHVITAPQELRFLPPVAAQSVVDLMNSLKQNYDTIVIDLPHLWQPWIATLLQHATHVVLVAQLWLKSVNHAARMTRTLRELHIPTERLVPVINRSGAKFKEAIAAEDFERVCGVGVRYTLANDIRTVTAAESSARSVLELGDSPLARDIKQLARGLVSEPLPPAAPKETGTKGGILGGLIKRG